MNINKQIKVQLVYFILSFKYYWGRSGAKLNVNSSYYYKFKFLGIFLINILIISIINSHIKYLDVTHTIKNKNEIRK